MSLVSIHQPAFNGWLGYFDKVLWSEKFVELDSVQFEKNSFTNRNYIKLANGDKSWLTIPLQLKGHMGKTIAEIQIDDSQKWRKKHLNSLQMNYSKAPYFNESMEFIQKIYRFETSSFSEFSYHALTVLLEFFQIEREIYRASSMNVESTNSNLVLDICKKLGAEKYLSGKLGRDYLDEKSFRDSGIEVLYQDFQHPSYQQYRGDFLGGMGIFDFMMNEGKKLKQVLGYEN